MSTKDLKQYIEKELHAKRFLQDGLDVVAALDSAKEEQDVLKRGIAASKKELDAANVEKNKTLEALKVIKADLATKAAEASTILSNTRDKADKIIQEAEKKAIKLIEDTNADLATVRNNIATYKEEEKQVLRDVAAANDIRTSLLSDIEKLRKKFA